MDEDDYPGKPRSNRKQSTSHSRSWLERLTHIFTGEPLDRAQFLEVARVAQQRNVIDGEALSMIEGALQVADMQVRDVMVPRAQMTCVPRDAAPEEILPIIVESGHSRFPVIGDDKDEIEGLLLAKDLLRYYQSNGKEKFDIRELLRPATFIPESKRLNVLLRDFRASRNHIAMVADEYGGVAGLVTIEDVLEQIVGEIDDEFDPEEEGFLYKHTEQRYTVKALMPIEDFNEHFGTDFDDQDFDTIGGLVLREFGHVPERGESVNLGRFQFTVLRADKRRVQLMEMRLVPESGSGSHPESPKDN